MRWRFWWQIILPFVHDPLKNYKWQGNSTSELWKNLEEILPCYYMYGGDVISRFKSSTTGVSKRVKYQFYQTSWNTYCFTWSRIKASWQAFSYCFLWVLFFLFQEDCPACSQVPQKFTFSEDSKLQEILDFLKESPQL